MEHNREREIRVQTSNPRNPNRVTLGQERHRDLLGLEPPKNPPHLRIYRREVHRMPSEHVTLSDDATVTDSNGLSRVIGVPLPPAMATSPTNNNIRNKAPKSSGDIVGSPIVADGGKIWGREGEAYAKA
ncbi:hypothetical protein QJS10_CPB11g01369 [Acorus calamus]|uniref:Uncharacterized protein n=1 Tax=Acorus calamus TaxID=4465 RepID=A0AAV9DVY2_ACOCL|nr:hypothetical protein QJS10_CPB11g01369 [Acorus calamus]